VVLAGDFPVHDLVDVGVDLPDGEYTSVAGLILDRLGRLPDRPGDRVRVGNWDLTVSRVDRRAITEVVLRPAPAPEDGAITP
jgi:putative hemolysin